MMNVSLPDTIAACATPPGYGGVGIIRVSGPAAASIAQAMLGKVPVPRYATLSDFKTLEGEVIDQGLALYFKSPHSFTGEDVLELQGHGGPIVLDVLLQTVLKLGARIARPGEFSERAFLNEKFDDLLQVEAIADLIHASSLQAARSAIQSFQGKFSQEIRALVQDVIHLRKYIEAAIDFPEEEVDFLSDGHILQRLEGLNTQLEFIFKRAQQGKALNEGMRVVIAGHPNAGKSSLLNALSGEETAIVSDIPGTTRDIIKETILLDGMPVYVLDTAGLRDSNDLIESEGVRRAWQEIPNADRILLVVDASTTPCSALHELIQPFLAFNERIILVRNKIDLVGENASIQVDNQLGIPIINISVKTAAGVNLLKRHLQQSVGYQCTENALLARRRHLDALQQAHQHCQQALEQLVVYKAGELVAQELREAQDELNKITGEFRSDDLLGEIFSSFCIGK